MGSFGTDLGPSRSYWEDVVLQVLGQSNKYWQCALSSGGRVDFMLPPYCLFVSMGQLRTIGSTASRQLRTISRSLAAAGEGPAQCH